VRSSAEELVRPTTTPGGSSPDAAVRIGTLVWRRAKRVQGSTCVSMHTNPAPCCVLQFAPLKQGIAKFYNESSGLWESVWGEHMHHGERAGNTQNPVCMPRPVGPALLQTSTTCVHQSSTQYCLPSVFGWDCRRLLPSRRAPKVQRAGTDRYDRREPQVGRGVVGQVGECSRQAWACNCCWHTPGEHPSCLLRKTCPGLLLPHWKAARVQ
jgi:hypothetical protein